MKHFTKARDGYRWRLLDSGFPNTIYFAVAQVRYIMETGKPSFKFLWPAAEFATAAERDEFVAKTHPKTFDRREA